MKIKFLLLDQDGDLLMTMYGHDYVPPIKEDILFRGESKDVDIHELAFVTEKYYDIKEDLLTIYCEAHDTFNEYGKSQFKKYNELIKKSDVEPVDEDDEEEDIDLSFPVHFNGKDYYEEDCSDLFLSFYNDIDALNELGGVYIAEGNWVYPDGSISEY